jgi:hypothetical protein
MTNKSAYKSDKKDHRHTISSGISRSVVEDLIAALKHSDLSDLSISGHPATIVSYDNTVSGLAATQTQAAIDEIDSDLDTHIANVLNPHSVTHAQLSDTATNGHPSSIISYDNTVSGLSATQVQAALDEIDDDLDTHIADTTNPHAVAHSQLGDDEKDRHALYRYYKLRSGRYYDSSYHVLYSAVATGTIGSNTLLAIPFYIPDSSSFDRIKVWPLATNANKFIRLGIYADNGSSYPGALISDYGSVAFTQYNSFINISETLSNGLYWLAFIHDFAVTNFQKYDADNSHGLLGTTDQAGSLPSNKEVAYEIAYTFGALPDPYPSSAISYTLSNIPVVAMRVS